MTKRITLFLLLIFPLMISAQSGVSIKGTITNNLGESLPGANVMVVGTTIGTASDIDGYYELKLPAKFNNTSIEIQCQFIGYAPKTETVNFTGAVVELDFVLTEDVLNLNEVVVTGLVAQTPKTKTALSVSSISGKALEQVPSFSVETALRGKVSGVKIVQGSGRPGFDADIMLRAPTSIFNGGRAAPLFIVDGVILADGGGATLTEIDPADIENIEVVRGPAAASLYGSRAANGIVSITTKRGAGLALNETRIRVRSEYGFKQLANRVPVSQYNIYKIDANGNYLDINGDITTDRRLRVLDSVDPLDPNNLDKVFRDNPYKQTFDNMEKFYGSGEFLTNSISISKKLQTTNFLASMSNSNNGGIMDGSDSYKRFNLRLNVDHNVSDKFKISASTYYTQSKTDYYATGSPLQHITITRADIDLTKKDANGNYLSTPDLANTEIGNPFYYVNSSDQIRNRKRFIGGGNFSYFINDMFTFEGDLGLDYSTQYFESYIPKGYRTSGGDVNLGELSQSDRREEAINGGLSLNFKKKFGDLITRASAKFLVEDDKYTRTSASGENFIVPGIRDLDNTIDQDKIDISSYASTIRSQGFYLIGAFDYKDRYVGDLLVRRDGSSLFGAANRWATYARGSFAYRISEEEFWPVKSLFPEFKLRASLGTAGKRPNFSWQYETFSFSGGVLAKNQLGNKLLKPENVKELELGLDFALMNLLNVEFNYTHSTSTNQIIRVPLRSFYGYTSQYKNIGEIESRTWELSVHANVLRTADMSLSLGLVADHFETQILQLGVPSFTSGGVFRYDDGVWIGNLYGRKFLHDLNELPNFVRNNYQNQFQVNDEGYVVWVGSGNNYTEGLGSNLLWGSSTTLADTISGSNYNYRWGMPIVLTDSTGSVIDDNLIGSTIPDFNLGFSVNFDWKGLSVYMLWDAQIGGDIYNDSRARAYRDNWHGWNDQNGKSDELKKPESYYSTLYQGRARNEHFVEDGTYLKLRELAVKYRFSGEQLTDWLGGILGNTIKGITFGVIGRNLLTFTDYSGYDPEVGTNDSQLGNAVIEREDSFSYPNVRTFTGTIEIEF